MHASPLSWRSCGEKSALDPLNIFPPTSKFEFWKFKSHPSSFPNGSISSMTSSFNNYKSIFKSSSLDSSWSDFSLQIKQFWLSLGDSSINLTSYISSNTLTLIIQLMLSRTLVWITNLATSTLTLSLVVLSNRETPDNMIETFWKNLLTRGELEPLNILPKLVFCYPGYACFVI